MEGVMMKNRDQYAVAVRTPDNEIVVEKTKYVSFASKHPWARLPLIRGVVTFVESMSIGMKILTYSAEFFEEEEQEGKVEKALGAVFKEKAESVMMALTMIVALVLAVGLFMVLPWFLAEWLGQLIDNQWMQALVEGLLRLAIFVTYVFMISLMKDIRRVYMYHGAEHKTINCVEQGLELTVENVKKQSREHKRCGTSFMLYVMVISILFFMCIRVDDPGLRIGLRLLLIPVVAGVSYEWIYWTSNHDGKIVNFLSRPGMWLQSLTTREPDDDMIEVAIQSVEAVFDWRSYLAREQEAEENKDSRRMTMVAMEVPKEIAEEEYKEKKVQPQEARRPVAAVKRADHSVRRGAYFASETSSQTAASKKEETKSSSLDREPAEEETKAKASEQPTPVAAVKRAAGTRKAMQPIEELRRDSILADSEQDDDDDEILRALDKFFGE